MKLYLSWLLLLMLLLLSSTTATRVQDWQLFLLLSMKRAGWCAIRFLCIYSNKSHQSEGLQRTITRSWSIKVWPLSLLTKRSMDWIEFARNTCQFSLSAVRIWCYDILYCKGYAKYKFCQKQQTNFIFSIHTYSDSNAKKFRLENVMVYTYLVKNSHIIIQTVQQICQQLLAIMTVKVYKKFSYLVSVANFVDCKQRRLKLFV